MSNGNGGTTPGNVTFHSHGLPWRDPGAVPQPPEAPPPRPGKPPQQAKIDFSNSANYYNLVIEMTADYDRIRPRDVVGPIGVHTRNGADARDIVFSLLRDRGWDVEKSGESSLLVKGWKGAEEVIPKVAVKYTVYAGPRGLIDGSPNVEAENGATVTKGKRTAELPDLSPGDDPAAWISLQGDEVLAFVVTMKTKSGITYTTDRITTPGPNSDRTESADLVAADIPAGWLVDTHTGPVRITGHRLPFGFIDPVESVNLTFSPAPGKKDIVTQLPSVMGTGGVKTIVVR